MGFGLGEVEDPAKVFRGPQLGEHLEQTPPGFGFRITVEGVSGEGRTGGAAVGLEDEGEVGGVREPWGKFSFGKPPVFLQGEYGLPQGVVDESIGLATVEGGECER